MFVDPAWIGLGYLGTQGNGRGRAQGVLCVRVSGINLPGQEGAMGETKEGERVLNKAEEGKAAATMEAQTRAKGREV